MPLDLPTQETLRFVREAAPAGARVLEVGCGAGAVAAELARAGCRVIGVDASPDAVAAARDRGVDARHAQWPDFRCEPQDVVFFGRSLHHVADLDGAVARAAESLAAGGCVVVEDFAYVEASPAARAWTHATARLLAACGILAPKPDSLLAHMLRSPSGDAAWAARDPHVHSAAAMEAALRSRFADVTAVRAPYLFRWFAEALPEDARTADALAVILDLERTLGDLTPSFLVGRRWVARSSGR